MNNDVPKIDDLLDGINDPDYQGGAEHQEDETSGTPNENEVMNTDGLSDQWDLFLSNVRKEIPATAKEERLVCKIDREIADSLDELNFSRSRSDLVNAIVLSFIATFKERLRDNKIQNRSLLR